MNQTTTQAGLNAVQAKALLLANVGVWRMNHGTRRVLERAGYIRWLTMEVTLAGQRWCEDNHMNFSWL